MSTNTPIASQTLTSATSEVMFTGIPQNFTDLVLVINNFYSTSSSPYISLQFNSDATSNYTSTHLEGDGSAASSNRFTSDTLMYFGYNVASSTTPSNGMASINIMNYSNTTTFKTVLGRVSIVNGTKPGVSATVGLWRKTPEAINSILIKQNAGNLPSGCVLNLYGIVSGSTKASGGTVTTDGTYYYHTFTSSGIFTPAVDLTADYLVLAGGGGGGLSTGGGGGAGGLRSTVTATGGGGSLESPLSLTAQAYTVTVGAGGAGTSTDGTSFNGSNSVFSTITSVAGGGGGTTATQNEVGKSGGSGGGAGSNISSVPGAGAGGGAGTANQGFAGGNAYQNGAPSYQQAGGGGGGAGVVGGNASNGTTAGNGGAGVATSITGSSVTYAGGGGGGTVGATAGTGGSGGGGAGTNSATAATNGTANLGAGGGGGRYAGSGNGGSGGSGIVIIRYAV